MLTLGLNLGETKYGKILKDGGACILHNGKPIVAISEERISRQKSSGGYKQALKYCLDSMSVSLNDIDLCIFSTCVEDSNRNLTNILPIDQRKIKILPSHHLSHAYCAYYLSGFEEAIVVVIDAGGNILDQQYDNNWWKYKREQHSYYIARGNTIKLIERDFFEPFEVGIGELYRAFTYYLGWHSYIYSGKTMALAAYGDKDRYKDVKLFYYTDTGRLKSYFSYIPNDPIQMIKEFEIEKSHNFGEPREPSEDFQQIHKDVASLIQSEIEWAIIEKVKNLVRKTGIKRVCFAGGVALNCQVNTRLLESGCIDELFIPPAAGDQGQCMGNALYGYYKTLNGKERHYLSHTYFGREYLLGHKDILNELYPIPDDIQISYIQDISDIVSSLLADGQIIAWFQGKSEFGPRALGNRSIFANPMVKDIRLKLNGKVKGRESILPYAASVLEENLRDYFHFDFKSPFMLLAPKIKERIKPLIAGVIHQDDSVRIQTVSMGDNPLLYSLISAFHKKTGVPIVLNTSLNGKDEPICETIEDAFKCFALKDIDHLVIGNTLFSKTH